MTEKIWSLQTSDSLKTLPFSLSSLCSGSDIFLSSSKRSKFVNEA